MAENVDVLSLEEVLDVAGIVITEIGFNQVDTFPLAVSGCFPSVSVLRHRFVNSDGEI